MTQASRSRRKWIIAAGAAAAILLGVALWFLVFVDSDKPYVGPPPPIEFEIKGYQVVSGVPFGGGLQIRDGVILPPVAPEGYEFAYQFKEIILGKPHAFGWKPKSGSIFLVVCKLSVKDPTPRLERIRLMRGKEEIATLDGLAQPQFDKASAKELNQGLADCHKSGMTPEVALVFRVPDGEPAKPNKLSVEMEWLNSEGKLLTGKYSLSAFSPVPTEDPNSHAGKQSADNQPVTLDGEWTGKPTGGTYVNAMVFEKNELPCNGEVRFFRKGGTTFDKPNDTFSFDKNQVRVKDGDKLEVISPVVWTKEGNEVVGTYAHNKSEVARVYLSGRYLIGTATVPPGIRLFMGNVAEIPVVKFEKRGK